MNVISDAYSASIGIAQDEKTGFLKALNNIGHNSIQATVGTVSNYVSDVIQPGWQTIKSAGNFINYKAYQKEGAATPFKAAAGVITNATTTVANAILGLGSGGRVLYRELIQTNAQLLQNGSSKHIPVVGTGFKHGSNILGTIFGAPAALYDKVAGYVNKGLHALNNSVALEGQTVYESKMRTGDVVARSTDAYDSNFQLR